MEGQVKELGKYHWIGLIVLAIICQLIVSRVVEGPVSQVIYQSDISKLDCLVLVAAPQSPFTCVQSKAIEDLKGDTGFAKFIDLGTNHHDHVPSNANLIICQASHQDKSSPPLWLLYRTLLL